MSDRPFLNRILLAVSRGPVRLFRCNRGTGWIGKVERAARATTVTVFPGDVVIRNARPLHAGLADGNGDLIGWVSREIRPEHVGQTWAVFASLEAKEGSGRMGRDQISWRDAVLAAGGIAAEVRTLDDAVRLVADRSSEN